MPGTCSQCEKLGAACVDKQQLGEHCDALGWSAEF